MQARTCALVALVVVAVTTVAFAQNSLDVLRLAPDDLDWVGDPGQVSRVDITGDRTKPGLYAYRARFPAGFRNEPHFHPDNRIVTVIAGTLHVGLGERFDEAALRPLPAGSLWTEPSDEPHFVWAKDGEVIIQIIGFGPSGTTQVER